MDLYGNCNKKSNYYMLVPPVDFIELLPGIHLLKQELYLWSYSNY